MITASLHKLHLSLILVNKRAYYVSPRKGRCWSGWAGWAGCRRLPQPSLPAVKNTVVQDAQRPNHARRRSASEDLESSSVLSLDCCYSRKTKGSKMRNSCSPSEKMETQNGKQVSRSNAVCQTPSQTKPFRHSPNKPNSRPLKLTAGCLFSTQIVVFG